MDVRFSEPSLALIETVRAVETQLPVRVIGTARRRLAVLRAAPDFDTLTNWKSFGLRSGAKFPGEHIIDVANDWEMMISFEDHGKPVSVICAVREAVKGRAAR